MFCHVAFTSTQFCASNSFYVSLASLMPRFISYSLSAWCKHYSSGRMVSWQSGAKEYPKVIVSTVVKNTCLSWHSISLTGLGCFLFLLFFVFFFFLMSFCDYKVCNLSCFMPSPPLRKHFTCSCECPFLVWLNLRTIYFRLNEVEWCCCWQDIEKVNLF